MGFLGRLRNWNEGSTWWHWTYFVDWGLLVAPILVWAPLHFLGPRCRDFDPMDPSINHPFVEPETFPNWSLPLVALVAPLVLGMLLVYPWRTHRVSFNHEAHSFFLTVVQAFLLALFVTDPMKNYAGRQRPDFVNRLRLDLNFTPENPPENYMEIVCASTSARVLDGMKSFPSGHASLSFAGWTVLGLLVMSRLPARVAQTVGYWRTIVASACFVLPTVVAVSRTVDYRHNYSDVVTGAVIGVVSGVAVFRQHYTLESEYPRNRKTGMSDPTPPTRVAVLSVGSPVMSPMSPLDNTSLTAINVNITNTSPFSPPGPTMSVDAIELQTTSPAWGTPHVSPKPNPVPYQ